MSVATLCHPVDHSMPGVLVFHHLLELAQTHVHQVNDAIQPSRPLSPPSPPALSLSQHWGLSNELAVCIRWPKYWISRSYWVRRTMVLGAQVIALGFVHLSSGGRNLGRRRVNYACGLSNVCASDD